MIERGFKRLAFCGIPHTRLTGWSERRQAAFEQYAREAGVPCSIFPVGSSPGGRAVKLHKQLSAWLQSLEKPVGLMACYDVRARHVLTVCQELGLLVPEDVAVIGVDNDELMCELTNPPLSSIEQGARTIGYQAAALLDQLMAGPEGGAVEVRRPARGDCHPAIERCLGDRRRRRGRGAAVHPPTRLRRDPGPRRGASRRHLAHGADERGSRRCSAGRSTRRFSACRSTTSGN